MNTMLFHTSIILIATIFFPTFIDGNRVESTLAMLFLLSIFLWLHWKYEHGLGGDVDSINTSIKEDTKNNIAIKIRRFIEIYNINDIRCYEIYYTLEDGRCLVTKHKKQEKGILNKSYADIKDRYIAYLSWLVLLLLSCILIHLYDIHYSDPLYGFLTFLPCIATFLSLKFDISSASNIKTEYYIHMPFSLKFLGRSEHLKLIINNQISDINEVIMHSMKGKSYKSYKLGNYTYITKTDC